MRDQKVLQQTWSLANKDTMFNLDGLVPSVIQKKQYTLWDFLRRIHGALIFLWILVRGSCFFGWLLWVWGSSCPILFVGGLRGTSP